MTRLQALAMYAGPGALAHLGEHGLQASHVGVIPGAAGGPKAVQGIAETAAQVGDALSVVTSYSYLVEAAAAIAFGQLVKPDASGKAVVGSLTEHCARALGAATQAGQLVEVQLLPHVHP